MLDYTKEDLLELGAEITTREIYQQPDVWKEAFESYQARRDEIAAFLKGIADKHDYIKVILTGAGTSAYVGDTLVPYFKEVYDERKWNFNAIATTDIVANPQTYLKKDVATVLVSFARSGNSPESLASVQLGQQIVKDFYQITITCAPEGKLALAAPGDDRNLLLMMPARSNDAGFAMTGSFTCMTLTALLIFDEGHSVEEKAAFVTAIRKMGESVLEREHVLQQFVDLDYNRVIYLGSGPLAGLAREVQLKILELTAGKIATIYDSSMGFRHGPKSFVDSRSLAFVFVSNDAYTRQYDLDILEEMYGDSIAPLVCAVGVSVEDQYEGTSFDFAEAYSSVPDAYLALPYAIFGQTIGLLSSIKVGNKPDTPSPSGTVNRVVKGVTIHPLNNQ